MEELSSIEREKQALPIKSQATIRCTRAALHLASLRISPNSSPSSHQFDHLKNDEVEEELMRELVKARMKNKKMRLCSRLEFFLRIAIFFALCTLCLLVAFIFLNSI